MASKLSIIIAICLFFLSWGLPSHKGELGIEVMAVALQAHLLFFLIIPVLYSFPVWANLTFLLTVKHFFLRLKNPQHGLNKAIVYAIVTINLMFIGIIFVLGAINIGALIWFVSGVFLVLALILQEKKYSEHYAVITLGIVITIILILGIKLYHDEKSRMPFQKARYAGLKHRLFQPKASSIEIPKLIAIQQYYDLKLNDAERKEWLSKLDSKPLDLSALENQSIEVDFEETVYIPPEKYKKHECKLDPQQQYFIIYPNRYWQKGYQWQQYEKFLGYFAVGVVAPNQTTLLYKAQRLNEHFSVIQISRKSDQQVLYKQKLVTHYDYSGCNYLPKAYVDHLDAAFSLTDDGAKKVKRLDNIQEKLKYSEELSQTCSWEKTEYNQYIFENKKLNFMRMGVFAAHVLCSKHYMAVISTDDDVESTLPVGNVILFHRKDLKPILCADRKFSLKDKFKVFLDGNLRIKTLKIRPHDESYGCAKMEAEFSDGTTDSLY